MNTLFELPVTSSSMPQSRGGGQGKVLYVEDDPVLRDVSKTVLTRAGYRVTAVEDGAQGWEALHSDDYDLLLVDTVMPQMSGLDLVNKARLEGMRLPAVVVSGFACILDENDCQRLNIAARVQKPFTRNDLLDAVGSVLHGESSEAAGDSDAASISTLIQRAANSYGHWGLNE